MFVAHRFELNYFVNANAVTCKDILDKALNVVESHVYNNTLFVEVICEVNNIDEFCEMRCIELYFQCKEDATIARTYTLWADNIEKTAMEYSPKDMAYVLRAEVSK